MIEREFRWLKRTDIAPGYGEESCVEICLQQRKIDVFDDGSFNVLEDWTDIPTVEEE